MNVAAPPTYVSSVLGGGTSAPKGAPQTSVAEALKHADPHARAAALETVCRTWADRHEWYYREAAEAFAFYHNDHYGYWDAQISSWVPQPDTPTDVPKLIYPIISPLVDTGVSLLSRDLPTFGAVAATSEGQDHAAGEAADLILAHGFRFYCLTDLYSLSAHRGFVAGTSPIHLQWDMTRGKRVQVGVRFVAPAGLAETAEAADGADDDSGGHGGGYESPAHEAVEGRAVDGPRIPEGVSPGAPEFAGLLTGAASFVAEPIFEPEGEACFTPLLPEEWVPDPVAKHPQDGVGCFVRQRMSLKTLVEQFPDHDWKRVSPGGMGGSEDAMDRSSRISTLSPHGSGAWLDRPDRDSMTCHTFYKRACPEYPLGYMAIFVAGRMLYEGPNPAYPNPDLLQVEENDLWPNHNWPVFVHRHLLRENSPFGLGAVTAAVKLQKAANGVYSKAVMHAAKIANARIYAPTGLDQEFSDVIGQVIRVPRDIGPNQLGYMSPPPADPIYIQLLGQAREAIENVMGVNRASAGVLPGDETSGVAIQALQSQDLGRLVPVKNRLDEQFRSLCAKYLFLWRRHVSVDRTVQVVGKNSATQVRALNRSSISAGIDLELYNRSSIPSTPSARFLAVTQMVNTKMLDPMSSAQDKGIAFDLLGLPDVRNLVQAESGHLRKARRNRLKIMDGEPVQISELDDLATHRKELVDLYVSEEFESRVAQEKRRGGGFSAVEQAFYVALGRVDELMAAQMAQAQGAAPAPQQPPGPVALPGGGAGFPPPGAQAPPPDGLTMTDPAQGAPVPATDGSGLAMPAMPMAA